MKFSFSFIIAYIFYAYTFVQRKHVEIKVCLSNQVFSFVSK